MIGMNVETRVGLYAKRQLLLLDFSYLWTATFLAEIECLFKTVQHSKNSLQNH
jgi:hypothetical protein